MRSPGVLVVAKAPVPGRVKTRLARAVGHGTAAELAAWALMDTLDAAEEAFPTGRRVLALSGSLQDAAHGAALTERLRSWTVIRQRGAGFGARLAAAHLDAAATLDRPIVQVGMDTPQATAGMLTTLGAQLARRRCDAVLAPAIDGGWWALGLHRPQLARCLAGVPMSTPTTGKDTANALRWAGARVGLGPWLRDVDELDDAITISTDHPGTRFAAAWSALPLSAWMRHADTADHALAARCRGATLDVGCGPGRMTHTLLTQGAPALGIDILPEAVALARARGASALVRDVFDPVPADGRWDCALLADGNIGIGGHPARLLRRVRGLLRDGGLVVLDLDGHGSPGEPGTLRLCRSDRTVHTFPWATVTPQMLAALGAAAGLRLVELTRDQGRWVAQLQRRDEDL